MAIFKGFEKNEADQLVAVVDFPQATKHSFEVIGGRPTRVSIPDPHEERLDEPTFAAKFGGADFEALKGLPFNENGHDLNQILAQANDTLRGPGPGIAPDPFKNGH